MVISTLLKIFYAESSEQFGGQALVVYAVNVKEDLRKRGNLHGILVNVQDSSPNATMPARVAVAGMGYVGCVTAACLSDLGHKVIGVDRDESKVRAVNEGRAPFYEPGLEEIIGKSVQEKRLSATTDIAVALENSDIVLVCVGTPSQKNGNFGLEQLERVCEDIARTLSSRTTRLIVAIRSTVYPGTCEEVVAPILGDSGKAVVVDNPEFLREGTAIKDFIEPSLLVIGGWDAEAVRAVADSIQRSKLNLVWSPREQRR